MASEYAVLRMWHAGPQGKATIVAHNANRKNYFMTYLPTWLVEEISTVASKTPEIEFPVFTFRLPRWLVKEKKLEKFEVE